MLTRTHFGIWNCLHGMFASMLEAACIYSRLAAHARGSLLFPLLRSPLTYLACITLLRICVIVHTDPRSLVS
ncbi:hypothetical protein EDD16DRAFT_503412 [Pisolithus croceorrhizus]|nr:hypothetical protein EDD16DRAFT_503412 [Pisolithus croceorrhizus]